MGVFFFFTFGWFNHVGLVKGREVQKKVTAIGPSGFLLFAFGSSTTPFTPIIPN